MSAFDPNQTLGAEDWQRISSAASAPRAVRQARLPPDSVAWGGQPVDDPRASVVRYRRAVKLAPHRMNKRTVHLLLSALLTLVGVVLAVGKIIFDSEPGLIPLVLTTGGLAWHFTARRRFPPGK